MKNTYKNKDFYLSSFLVASGCKLLKHTRNGKLTTFEFEDSEDVRKYVEDYYGLKSVIEPLCFVGSIRILKSIIHSANTKETYNNGNRFIKR